MIEIQPNYFYLKLLIFVYYITFSLKVNFIPIYAGQYLIFTLFTNMSFYYEAHVSKLKIGNLGNFSRKRLYTT